MEDTKQPQPPMLALFEPLLEKTFGCRVSEEVTLEVELIEAKALPPQRGAPRQDPFTLLFRAPPDCGLNQGMACLEHDQTGPLDLFLVPIGRDAEGLYLEAIFN